MSFLSVTKWSLKAQFSSRMPVHIGNLLCQGKPPFEQDRTPFEQDRTWQAQLEGPYLRVSASLKPSNLMGSVVNH